MVKATDCKFVELFLRTSADRSLVSLARDPSYYYFAREGIQRRTKQKGYMLLSLV